MSIRSSLLSFVVLAAFVSAAPSQTDTAKRATCTVNSVASASGLSSCTDVVIEAFTVPAGDTITIAAASASGPLITFDTDNINFNGGNNKIDGNGALYWDGQGTNGGSFKPHPLVKFKGYGTFSSVTVLNTPAQAISVGTTDTSTIQQVTVDNSAGASLGHNTDGFDISADSVTVSQCQVTNQDDCVAVNSGDSVLIENTTCTGGHGISIGSIVSGKSVTNFRATGNTVSNSKYGLRIKVDADATSAQVSGATNTLSGISDYGILISQSYPTEDGSTVGTGGPISGVAFTGAKTTLAVDSTAYSVVVNCGACSGTWDWSELDVTSAGEGHKLSLDKATISGGTY
ncbi:unnamed protein product [Mycena citricolor]|uniref:Glycoside hydrolase family 28 protein n=1 Tax=Mycena citricolor TaxID=2018698 RepID=A0AAD2H6T8_9AGAR|nr:unnamed protein product [Mycena citricolor]CAK5283903.1 unnamed protein product [Mycena citricolor]